MKTHFVPGFLIGGWILGLAGVAVTWCGPVQVRDNVIADMELMIEKHSRSIFDADMPGCKITYPDGQPISMDKNKPKKIFLPKGTEITSECFK